MWEKTAAFWTERNAWTAALRTQQRTRGNVSPAGKRLPTLDQKRGYWKNYTRRLEGVTRQTGRVRFEADPGFIKVIQELIAKVVPRLAMAYDWELSGVMRRAFDSWPVQSGYSKSSLFIGFTQISEFEFAAELGCGAEYAIYIKNSPNIRLLRDPTLQAGDRILRSLRLGQ